MCKSSSSVNGSLQSVGGGGGGGGVERMSLCVGEGLVQ